MIDSGGRKDDIGDMTALQERLAKLEGAFDWIKTTFGILVAIVMGGIAFLGVQSVRLDSKVSALPGEISAGLRETNRSFMDALTAARSQSPQVIMLPAPTLLTPPIQEAPATKQ